MATAIVARNLTKAIPRSTTSATSSLRLAARPTRASLARHFFQQSSRRQYSSTHEAPKSTRRTAAIYGTVAATAALAGGAYYFATTSRQELKNTIPEAIPEVHLKKGSGAQSLGLFTPTASDYQKVYNEIAKQLWEKDDYDDGSYGPVLLRLAWHSSGTYDAETNTGGSNGATMRFAAEGMHSANGGLQNARAFLEPIKQQFPWISYGDLWTLGGVCAVQEMQGPAIPWRPGRQDKDESFCTPDGRLPDGSKTQDHIRAIFGRMGFTDQEMVALSGAHALGRGHADRSGFEGPWTFSPTVFTNDYFRLLMEEKWGWKSWEGNKQYEDASTKTLMMLPSDVALIQDPVFKGWVEKYAKDSDLFFRDFASVLVKLFELGVPFKEGSQRLEFKSTVEE
ncbi:heme peroxidase [Cladophialophora chaetospira]|uniref:Peroxidase n=1 Tax=Cladophialophora chaetospira TaxID=386627 RepID=A0AA38X1K5_9EURO|nr:heme peroxidase [Cladophialophora chaetospira]